MAGWPRLAATHFSTEAELPPVRDLSLQKLPGFQVPFLPQPPCEGEHSPLRWLSVIINLERHIQAIRSAQRQTDMLLMRISFREWQCQNPAHHVCIMVPTEQHRPQGKDVHIYTSRHTPGTSQNAHAGNIGHTNKSTSMVHVCKHPQSHVHTHRHFRT